MTRKRGKGGPGKTWKCRDFGPILFISLFFLVLVVNEIEASSSSSSWWFTIDKPIHCNRIPGLVKRQRHLCRKNPELMTAVAEGIALGIRECQFQFKLSRWNCSLSDTHQRQQNNRESSLVNAIQSAAVVFILIRECNKGVLPGCTCDTSKNGLQGEYNGDFAWGGCSANIKFSSAFTRRFIDASQKRQRDVRAQTILHNNRLGRKSIKRASGLQCKCHGVSGSCSYRTCWLTVAPFRQIGRWLKRRYDRAARVNAKPDGTGLFKVSNNLSVKKLDLVFLEKSPNYCTPNIHRGVTGTAGRECNATSVSTDGCKSLCCGRGFYTQSHLVEHQCNCTFRWCCSVTCQKCESLTEFSYCKES